MVKFTFKDSDSVRGPSSSKSLMKLIQCEFPDDDLIFDACTLISAFGTEFSKSSKVSLKPKVAMERGPLYHDAGQRANVCVYGTWWLCYALYHYSDDRLTFSFVLDEKLN